MEHSNSNLNEDAEVDLLDSSPGNAKQMLYTAWIGEWMMKNNSTMLDLSGNFNCHGYAQASTVTILAEFFKILLQYSSTMLADDEQLKKQAKEMKNSMKKVKRILR